MSWLREKWALVKHALAFLWEWLSGGNPVALLLLLLLGCASVSAVPQFDRAASDTISSFPCPSSTGPIRVYRTMYGELPGYPDYFRWGVYWRESHPVPFLVVEFDAPNHVVQAWLYGTPVSPGPLPVCDLLKKGTDI